jgi:hypothetical protein
MNRKENRKVSETNIQSLTFKENRSDECKHYKQAQNLCIATELQPGTYQARGGRGQKAHMMEYDEDAYFPL